MFSITRFAQLLEALPRAQVERLSETMRVGRYDKTFKPYDHLLALLYAQFSGARSLREVETGFNAQAASHYHLGTQALRRTTLSDANQRRDPALFKALAERLMAGIHRNQRRELKQLLFALDSTPIQTKGHGFDWADGLANARTHGLKLHLLLECQGETPVYLNLTDARTNDISDARTMPLEGDAVYVMDRGYCDYGWWLKIQEAGSIFVTRFKRNSALSTLRENLPEGEGILGDALVSLRHRHNRAGHTNPYHGQPLRRIVVTREDGEPLVLATNDLNSPAAHIAGLYRRRWQIELFFKWIKQNLKLKQFLGRSRNAVSLQIYAAIIGYLLLWHYRAQHSIHPTQSLHLLLVELRQTLFERIATQAQRSYRRLRQERDQFIARTQHAITF